MQKNIHHIARYFSLPDVDIEKLGNLSLENLRLNSQKVEPNDVFIAIKGANENGSNYISDAIKKGAQLILSESNTINIDSHVVNERTVYEFKIPNLVDKLSQFAETYYDVTSQNIQLVGITGTNGKTTISQLLSQWSDLIGQKSASIGTLGQGLYNHLSTTDNTTPSAIELSQCLASFKQDHANFVAMEVSSHALMQGRVSALHFDAAIFTNLSRDHLDYHGTIDEYEKAKWRLFSSDKNEQGVQSSTNKIINIDDVVGLKWANQLKNEDRLCIVSSNPNIDKQIFAEFTHYVSATNISFNQQGTMIEFDSNFGRGHIKSQLLGSFNVSNVLLSLATLLMLDYPLERLLRVSEKLSPVLGRMELFKSKHMATTIVDYAHTPDALNKALNALSEHNQGEIWVVFGCGGDRDKGKRPLMAQESEKKAAHIIITNDNPRTEDPKQIINDIMTGFTHKKPIIIADRAKAIEYAIKNANKDDLILIAGKGHEDYQIIGHDKIDYSDREQVQKWMVSSND